MVLFLVVSACLQPPPLPPAPLAPRVPEGCLGGLAGRWVLSGDPTWTYDATDDGGTLELVARRAAASLDAGFRPRRFRRDAGAEAPGPLEDGGPTSSPGDRAIARIVAERTPVGFVGATRAPARDALGRDCEASFRTEVLECGDAGLLLKTEPSIELDERCQTTRHGAAPTFVEHRLVRVPSGQP
jgi:hypothetical protein